VNLTHDLLFRTLLLLIVEYLLELGALGSLPLILELAGEVKDRLGYIEKCIKRQYME